MRMLHTGTVIVLSGLAVLLADARSTYGDQIHPLQPNPLALAAADDGEPDDRRQSRTERLFDALVDRIGDLERMADRVREGGREDLAVRVRLWSSGFTVPG
ncbi:hypothetical protein ACFL59_02305, partial [Planctomycetota bacterium]